MFDLRVLALQILSTESAVVFNYQYHVLWSFCDGSGSITQFGVEQKPNDIVTLVKIITRFCHEQNSNKRPTIA